MKILGIIPARHASQRFPAKMLAKIGGKTIIQRVYEQAKKSRWLAEVVVATDHPSIEAEVKSFAGKVVMTQATHRSGTDRCFEALSQQTESYDFVINIQGDEPFIKPEQIDILANCLIENRQTQLATLVNAIGEPEDLFNPHVVKAIFNEQKEAIYFSRHPIPFIRNEEQSNWHKEHIFYRHVGIYAYRSDILEKITLLPASSLELAESLEQLRWLENGFKIKIAVTPYHSMGIDTPKTSKMPNNTLGFDKKRTSFLRFQRIT